MLESMQHPDSTKYNLPAYAFVPLSFTRKIEETFRALSGSYPELHTRFVIGENGELRQWCDMSMEIPVVSRKCTEAQLRAYISKGFVRPFNLFGAEPLIRLELIETETELCVLFDCHHSILDRWSCLSMIVKPFEIILGGGSIETQPSYGMCQAALDETASFDTPLYQRAKEYYAGKFGGMEFATLSQKKPGTMGRMDRYKVAVSRKECDLWCQMHDTQAILLFQAAFSHVISVLTRNERVAYTTVNHGRMDKRLRNSLGMYARTVPILANADPDQKVMDFVRSFRGELMSSIRYGVYPFTHFCNDLNMRPGISFNFLAVDELEVQATLDNTDVRIVQPVRDEVDSDMSVAIFLEGDDYVICAESSLAMNDAQTLRMVVQAVKASVFNMMAHPESKLGEIDIISDDERKSLIELGKGAQLDTDPQMTVVKAFEQCAAMCPDSLAVSAVNGSYTYRELSQRTDVLAHRLIGMGVRPGDFVAVMLPRVKEYPLAVLAVLKAGAAFVPIDREYPEQRRQYILDDVSPKVIIDERFISGIDLEGEDSPVDLSFADGLSYMIYTSGSTGHPKGVMLHHAGLWNMVRSFVSITCLKGSDRVAGYRSFSFDAHVDDLFPILTEGGSLHIMPEGIRRDISEIRQFLIDNRISIVEFPTPIGKLLLDTYDDLPIRMMAVGGEKLRNVSGGDMTIVNIYGPTECTNDTSFYIIPQGVQLADVPIGRPCFNGCYFLTGTNGRLVPRGAVGELCYAGIQVGRGYWHNAELTSQVFCGCPFLPAGADGNPLPMYRTGDLCRWNSDGQMEYVGRKDNQVKLRGYRIELEEIEACASGFEGMRQTVAVVRPVSGTDTLCLYYTAGTDIDTESLRRYLSEHLASFMVPAVYMRLESMPLTSNGKTDRNRLPEPSAERERIEAPSTELERKLFAVTSQVLGTDAFGVTTNLVSIGMSSLDAMRLSVAVEKQTGLKITVSELLDQPDIRHMAQNAGKEKGSDVDLSAFRCERESYPLTENQRGLYIAWELNRATTQYNVPVAICVGQTDAHVLADTIRNVVDAHSYIKTRLANREGVVVQLRRDDAPVHVPVIALSIEPDRSFFQERVRPFDLFNDDLYRFEIYTYGGRTWLFKDFHHIISDGISDSIFLRDLLAGMDGRLPQKEDVTAFEYTLYENSLKDTERYAHAREYFDSLLPGAEAASYPLSGAGGEHKSGILNTLVADSETIRSACSRMGVTPNSYFQTVVTQVLHQLTRQERIMIATVSGGRSVSQTESMMGMFVRTLPLVSDEGGAGVPFSDAVQTIHRQSIESMGMDFYPFTDVVERHDLHPEILFAYEGGIFDGMSSRITDKDLIILSLDTPKMPIEITVYTDLHGAYHIQVGYDQALYSLYSVQALADAITAYATNAAQDGIKLGEIEMVSDDERRSLVDLGTGDPLDTDLQMTVVKAFEQCAARCPDSLAVSAVNGSYTYRELSHGTDALAQRLIDSGVRPGDFVAIMLPRVKEYPLAVLAVLKAGAAFVPIDMEYPEQRRQYILDDASPKVVIDEVFISGTDLNAAASPVDLSSADGLSYMIYTSGSTGHPKGVMLHHAGLWNLVRSFVSITGLKGSDRVAGHRSFSFDAHVDDLFPILTEGGSLHIMPEQIRRDVSEIRQFLIDNRISVAGFTTPIAKLLLDTYDDLPLRLMSSSGEKLQSVFSTHMTIFNMYGPTECTNDISFYRLAPGVRLENIPIGRPLGDGYIFLTGPDGRLVPRGAVGELCYAGIQVGRGYLNKPELTAQAFCGCPFLPVGADGNPVPMYRTGDLCRWNADGQIEYVGRKDNQVKLRGYRIELEEIEACASVFEGMRQTVAVVRPVSGTDTLCLYYTAGTDIDTGCLKRYLSERLASFMVPEAYIRLDSIPRTDRGKTDRRNLPEPALTVKTERIPPHSEKEGVVLLLAQHVLGRDDFGVTDDLFELGLSSITAIKLVVMAESYGVHFSVNDLMRLRTIERLFAIDTPIGYWFNAYSPEKPVLVVPHGVVPVICMTAKFHEWQDIFSIYTLEPTEEHASKLSPDNDYDTLINAYADILDRDIPKDARVFGFLGYSWGGELAYLLARIWQKRHGGIPNVYLCDVYINQTRDTNITEEEMEEKIFGYLSSHLMDFDLRSFIRPEAEQNGNLVGMALTKMTTDDVFAQEIMKMAARKFLSGDRFCLKGPLPVFDCSLTYFVAVRENPYMEETMSGWRNLVPDMKVVRVDDNHFTFANRNDSTHVVTERLLSDLKGS